MKKLKNGEKIGTFERTTGNLEENKGKQKSQLKKVFNLKVHFVNFNKILKIWGENYSKRKIEKRN